MFRKRKLKINLQINYGKPMFHTFWKPKHFFEHLRSLIYNYILLVLLPIIYIPCELVQRNFVSFTYLEWIHTQKKNFCNKNSEFTLKHGAILYNEAEVFSLSITNPNGRPMLPFDWLIHSSLILVSCHRILFLYWFSAVEK